MNKSLSNYDIMKGSDNECKVIKVPDLYLFKDLDDLFEDKQGVVLLYEFKPRYGHWTLLTKLPHEKLKSCEFFDSYGYFPDDELKYIDKHYREISKQTKTQLNRLMQNSFNNYKLHYNNYQFQEHDNNIATCGRHCLLRFAFRGLNIDEYKDLLDSFDKNYDELVTKFVEI